MFVNAQQRYIASHPGLSNPLCITVGFSGLQNEFDSLTSHAGGEEWSTELGFATPLIPHQVEASQDARGIFDENGNGVVTYGGRGFAVPARVEPELLAYGIGQKTTAIESGGQGGQFAVTIEPVADPTDPAKTSHWRIASATAAAGVGSGYSSTGFVVVAVGDSICASPPSITLGVGRGLPKLTARPNTAACNCNGSGAEFSLTYTQSGSGNSATWAVSAIEVVNGGTGYPASGSLAFSQGLDGRPSFGSLPTATFQSTAGVIASVSVVSGGATYTDGVPTGAVTVSNTSRGAYYKEDRSLPAYTYSEYFSQYGLVVDDDLDSDTFGQVTQGPPQGEDGPPYECRNGCLASYNDREYLLCTVLSTSDSAPFSQAAVSLCLASRWGSGGDVEIVIPAGYDNGPTGITQVNVVSPGEGYALRGRAQPTPTFSCSPGSGASFSATLSQITDSVGQVAWEVASLSVTGGSGYQDRSNVFAVFGASSYDGGNGPVGELNTKRIAPTLSATACQGSGSGAALSVQLSPTESDLPVWSVSAVTVTNGGSGYEQGQPITFAVTSPSTRTVRAACAYCVVDKSGAIDSVVVVAGKQGEYYRHTDEPHSVSFGIPGTSRGAFWLNDDTQPATVELQVRVAQNEWFSQGSGAVIVANVETNPGSAHFGQIVSASVQNPGSGYKLRSATEYGVTSARLLPTRANVLPHDEHFRRAPFAETEASISYFNGYYNAAINYTIEAHLTAPDCNGVRKAEVVLSENGYTLDRGMRTDVPCRRAFAGEGSGDTINLTAADGLPGTAYITLEGDGGDADTFPDIAAIERNCDGRREDDCNICRSPRLQSEGSAFQTPEDAIFRLYPVLGDCNPQDPNDPPSTQRPAYWVNLDDDGNVVSWYKVCGSCPPGYDEVAPTQSPEVPGTTYIRTVCECYSDGFCFWKPVWDENVTPTLVDGAWTNCGDGTIEFDKTTCANPLP